mmetsp:Transcript_2522/g.6595  ORF Transcript_2522/g.6595 Transcript_2522/m.6595 type:complete len:133 (-) Transcript_2522:46-444(-)
MPHRRIPNSSVQGSIPSAWSALKNLRWLDLSGNNLAGTLPWNFGVLTSLLVLDVSKNDITVTPNNATITTAPSLLYFAVPPACRTVDPLPLTLYALTPFGALASQGELPESFSRLTNLRHLYVAGHLRLNSV